MDATLGLSFSLKFKETIVLTTYSIFLTPSLKKIDSIAFYS